MSVFSKILESLSKNISKELDKQAQKSAGKKASKNTIKGDNFTMQKDSTPPSPQIKIQTDMQQDLKNLST